MSLTTWVLIVAITSFPSQFDVTGASKWPPAEPKTEVFRLEHAGRGPCLSAKRELEMGFSFHIEETVVGITCVEK